MTKVLATNITLVNNSQDIRNDVNTGLVREAIYVGENTSIELNKSVISGFNPAVILQNTIAINDENLNKNKNTEILLAFLYYKSFSDKTTFTLFYHWIINNHLFEAKETTAESIIRIFNKIKETSVPKSNFVCQSKTL